LGDSIRIRVAHVDIKRRHVNLVLAEGHEAPEETPPEKKERRPSSRRRGKRRAEDNFER
jgi:transcriptional accessory protein Tex/SPT6